MVCVTCGAESFTRPVPRGGSIRDARSLDVPYAEPTADRSAPTSKPGLLDVSALKTGIPHPAGVYDYFLGGKDNFEADRTAGEAARRMPAAGRGS